MPGILVPIFFGFNMFSFKIIIVKYSKERKAWKSHLIVSHLTLNPINRKQKLDQVNNANSLIISLINLSSVYRDERVVRLVRVVHMVQVVQVLHLLFRVVRLVRLVRVVQIVQVVKVVSLDYKHSENIWFIQSKPKPSDC